MSYSQAGQDLFALSNKKYEGYFIDIGCHHPILINNTYLLEKNGWNGLSFDIDDYSELYKNKRSTKFICCNALNFDFKECFIKNKVPKNIDYLSLDIDLSTFECLTLLPLKDYSFNVVTIEHDEYAWGSEIKNKIRNYLFQHNYTLAQADVSNGGNIFEDWFKLCQ